MLFINRPHQRGAGSASGKTGGSSPNRSRAALSATRQARGTGTGSDDTIAAVQARNSALLGGRVDCQIARADFREGSRVPRGDLLVPLDLLSTLHSAGIGGPPALHLPSASLS
ncbi:MAG: hypothetical protein KGL43_09795 [Burkholderiales bacterium]|nr:hypothetical protein [Burkholderiales bacterium]